MTFSLGTLSKPLAYEACPWIFSLYAEQVCTHVLHIQVVQLLVICITTALMSPSQGPEKKTISDQKNEQHKYMKPRRVAYQVYNYFKTSGYSQRVFNSKGLNLLSYTPVSQE